MDLSVQNCCDQFELNLFNPPQRLGMQVLLLVTVCLFLERMRSVQWWVLYLQLQAVVASVIQHQVTLVMRVFIFMVPSEATF